MQTNVATEKKKWQAGGRDKASTDIFFENNGLWRILNSPYSMDKK